MIKIQNSIYLIGTYLNLHSEYQKDFKTYRNVRNPGRDYTLISKNNNFLVRT